MIKKTKEVLVLDNGFVRVYNDEVLFNGKAKGNYIKFSLSERFPNYGVAIICEHEGKFALMDNFRYAHQAFSTEIVKGMGMKDKTPIETALIEVREEIGGIVDKIEELGQVRGDMTDIIVHCFHVKIKGLKEVKHEETEVIENIRFVELKEVKQLIRKNKIQDDVTLALFAKIF